MEAGPHDVGHQASFTDHIYAAGGATGRDRGLLADPLSGPVGRLKDSG
jgi:hypothetical protein